MTLHKNSRDSRHKRGQQAENIARNLLIKNGMTLILENYYCRMGEIDLILLDQDCLVFVEVRARINARFVSPIDSIDFYKQRKILLTADFFLQNNPQYSKMTCRFDVVGVNFSHDPPSFEWIKGAFC
ncbi:MAG: YraN family protein [Gammaproteobacteria bacterium]|nr:YraN family protein [Gammaproteobacteria bacterium]